MLCVWYWFLALAKLEPEEIHVLLQMLSHDHVSFQQSFWKYLNYWLNNLLIYLFQILHRNISVDLLFPDPWREGDPGFWPQKHIQSFLWGHWGRMWTAHTLENCLLMCSLTILTHTSAKSISKSDIYLYEVYKIF